MINTPKITYKDGGNFQHEGLVGSDVISVARLVQVHRVRQPQGRLVNLQDNNLSYLPILNNKLTNNQQESQATYVNDILLGVEVIHVDPQGQHQVRPRHTLGIAQGCREFEAE
jgi:hypothetical protein